MRSLGAFVVIENQNLRSPERIFWSDLSYKLFGEPSIKFILFLLFEQVKAEIRLVSNALIIMNWPEADFDLRHERPRANWPCLTTQEYSINCWASLTSLIKEALAWTFGLIKFTSNLYVDLYKYNIITYLYKISI